jgi:hypothetical protein
MHAWGAAQGGEHRVAAGASADPSEGRALVDSSLESPGPPESPPASVLIVPSAVASNPPPSVHPAAANASELSNGGMLTETPRDA